MVIKNDLDKIVRFLVQTINSDEIVISERDLSILDKSYSFSKKNLHLDNLDELDSIILGILAKGTKEKNYCKNIKFQKFKDYYMGDSDKLRIYKFIYVLHRSNMVLNKYSVDFDVQKLENKRDSINLNFVYNKVAGEFYDDFTELTLEESVALGRSVRLIDSFLSYQNLLVIEDIIQQIVTPFRSVSGIKGDHLIEDLINSSLRDSDERKLFATLSTIHKVNEQINNYKLVK